MENHKLNMVLLTDFSETCKIALKYAVSIAKKVRSNLQLFHARRLKEVIDSENPIMVLRDLNSTNDKIESKLKSLVRSIKQQGVRASYAYSIGNVNGEIGKHLSLSKPELVIIGKRNNLNKPLGRTTNYLINKYSGSVLIISKEGEFQGDTNICLACNIKNLYQYDLRVLYALNGSCESSVKLFDEKGELVALETTAFRARLSSSKYNHNRYTEHTERPIDVEKLKEYISNKSIELLCIDKGKHRNVLASWFFDRYPTAIKVAKEIHIPILIGGGKTEINNMLN